MQDRKGGEVTQKNELRQTMIVEGWEDHPALKQD